MREGFWYSKYEPHLPMPVASGWTSAEAQSFAEKLTKVEAKAERMGYMGLSTCRLCPNFGNSAPPFGKMNGSREFNLEEWTWPEGLMHYIVSHDLKPSAEFVAFIESKVP